MIATPTEKEIVLDLLIEKLQQEGFTEIRAQAPSLDTPDPIFLRDSGQTHTPDLVAIQSGGRYYFDIDQRNPIPLKLSRHKWVQMVRWAGMKYGRYFLVVDKSQVDAVTAICQAEQIDMGVLALDVTKNK